MRKVKVISSGNVVSGYFHQWIEKREYIFAIIEDINGRAKEIPIEDIMFVDNEVTE
jgi:hypothetical protein